ncbi:endonuclease/exonuclease/phosphatase family protein [Halobacteriovorax sp.]|uniref:endonuclease/exonuclease/phosphatase family protein n=1 Tax=Halobacteriovorax sp. TaxID=2020862 RepID=UPI00356ADADB
MKLNILLIITTLCVALNANAWLGVQVPKDSNVIKIFGSASKTEIDKETVNLFVWNMYKANKESWKYQFKSQIPYYDFFLLQEMLTKPEVVDIFSNTESLDFITATSFIYKKSGERTGVATGSKYSPSWSKFLRSQKREPILSTPKMTLFTKYSISGSDEELLIVNIHAINFVSSQALRSQLQDVSIVIKSHYGPVVFAGDFNTWTNEKQGFLKEITEELGMEEVTFKNDTRKKMFGFILDFIFVRDIKVLSSNVHDDLNGSDHNAISVKLKFIKH